MESCAKPRKIHPRKIHQVQLYSSSWQMKVDHLSRLFSRAEKSKIWALQNGSAQVHAAINICTWPGGRGRQEPPFVKLQLRIIKLIAGISLGECCGPGLSAKRVHSCCAKSTHTYSARIICFCYKHNARARALASECPNSGQIGNQFKIKKALIWWKRARSRTAGRFIFTVY